MLLAALVLGSGPSAAAQSRDEFSYWDGNGNGDLTCSEALDRDEGLRLPAYKDNRDGTGIIYEWLERQRSSDTDNDDIACDSSSNPRGYIPKAQTEDPQPTGCPPDAETWRGLKVCEERSRDDYDRGDYGSGYTRLEDDIIAALPATMKKNGQVYTPYSCIAFDITSTGTAATDIEHIVALAEAHDSGIADDRRWRLNTLLCGSRDYLARRIQPGNPCSCRASNGRRCDDPRYDPFLGFQAKSL